ncbi:MAG: hypothetical protein AB7S26_24790 [Sandaracinaceae bacterium]
MRGHALALLAAIVGLGCRPPTYVPPSVSEPHATVTVRVLHHRREGPQVAHRTMIDDHELPLGERQAMVEGVPLTRSVRVRPMPIRWGFRSEFFHHEMQMRTVYESEQYPCGTQTVGYGSSARSSTRYCTRQVPRQRWQNVTVRDGTCESFYLHTPQVGMQYVVQFDYMADQQCRTRCFVQTPTANGQFQLTPCDMPLPARAARPSPPAPPATSGGEGGPAPPYPGTAVEVDAVGPSDPAPASNSVTDELAPP